MVRVDTLIQKHTLFIYYLRPALILVKIKTQKLISITCLQSSQNGNLVSKVNAKFKTYESDLGLDRSSRILELDYIKNYSSLYRTFATNIHTGISASGHQYTGVYYSVLLTT